jgi:hypothetical protein
VNGFQVGAGRNAGRGDIVEGADRFSIGSNVTTGEIASGPILQAVTRIGGSVDLCELDCESAKWEIAEAANLIR